MTYQARPLGYRREWQMVEDFYNRHPHFSHHNSYHLTKRYKAIRSESTFLYFQKEQLYTEFTDSLMSLDI
nr:hypothetical protein [Streptococcus sp. DD13]